MTLSSLLLAAGSARLTYLALTHRKALQKEGQEIRELLATLRRDKEKLTSQLQHLKTYQVPLQQVNREIRTSLRIYRQSTAGNRAALAKKETSKSRS